VRSGFWTLRDREDVRRLGVRYVGCRPPAKRNQAKRRWRARAPHFGGHIERLIGTMMGAVHLLPGTRSHAGSRYYRSRIGMESIFYVGGDSRYTPLGKAILGVSQRCEMPRALLARQMLDLIVA